MAKPDMVGHESEEIISIEVEDPNSRLTTSIREMIREASPLSPECCIYRAPKSIRQYNEKAFDPLVVSIGPFHHGKEELQPMERLKAAYLGAFLTRGDISLETCIKLVREWENSIRDCYAETIEFSSDDFVKMILLDSCFVIDVILTYNNVNIKEEVTDHLSHPRMGDVMGDMILLENQVPFFGLQGLFNLAAFPNSESTDKWFINLCIIYLSTLLLSGDTKLAKRNINRQQPSKVKHLLDLLRICQAPSIPRQNPGIAAKSSMWNANKLEEAGMVIKPAGLNYSSATDISYTTGVLEIPKLSVNSSSERVLRNLIALEWCLYYRKSYISDYIHFMHFLIGTSKDVELLIRNGIINSFSNDSNEVATLFNNLRPALILKRYFYYGIQEEVNACCNVPRHKWRVTLRRDYCSSPWMIASTIAAMILLTFIQAVCSIISVS